MEYNLYIASASRKNISSYAWILCDDSDKILDNGVFGYIGITLHKVIVYAMLDTIHCIDAGSIVTVYTCDKSLICWLESDYDTGYNIVEKFKRSKTSKYIPLFTPKETNPILDNARKGANDYLQNMLILPENELPASDY